MPPTAEGDGDHNRRRKLSAMSKFPLRATYKCRRATRTYKNYRCSTRVHSLETRLVNIDGSSASILLPSYSATYLQHSPQTVLPALFLEASSTHYKYGRKESLTLSLATLLRPSPSLFLPPSPQSLTIK